MRTYSAPPPTPHPPTPRRPRCVTTVRLQPVASRTSCALRYRGCIFCVCVWRVLGLLVRTYLLHCLSSSLGRAHEPLCPQFTWQHAPSSPSPSSTPPAPPPFPPLRLKLTAMMRPLLSPSILAPMLLCFSKRDDGVWAWGCSPREECNLCGRMTLRRSRSGFEGGPPLL